jgi:hypothetical protein
MLQRSLDPPWSRLSVCHVRIHPDTSWGRDRHESLHRGRCRIAGFPAVNPPVISFGGWHFAQTSNTTAHVVNASDPKDRRSARIAIVERHIRLENGHDLEGVLRTFGETARYDDEPWNGYCGRSRVFEDEYQRQYKQATRKNLVSGERTASKLCPFEYQETPPAHDRTHETTCCP